MSPVHRLLLALAVPAATLAAAGCAQGSGPSQEQYAAQATSVCESAAEEIDAVYMDHAVDQVLAAQAGEEDSYEGRSDRWVRAEVVPEYEGMANRLKGIPRPEGDSTYLSDLYVDLDARVEMLHLRPGDGRAVIESDTMLRDRFTGYGIETCPPAFDETPDWEDPAKVLEAAEERIEAEEAPPTVSGGGASDE